MISERGFDEVLWQRLCAKCTGRRFIFPKRTAGEPQVAAELPLAAALAKAHCSETISIARPSRSSCTAASVSLGNTNRTSTSSAPVPAKAFSGCLPGTASGLAAQAELDANQIRLEIEYPLGGKF